MKQISILFIFLFSCSYLFSQKIIQGRIIKVTDGDTVTLLTKNNRKIKIRLYGIDCPEKGQDYYQEAKNYVTNNVYNKNVQAEIKNKDRYQRSVGIIWCNKTNLNINLLKNGLAWHYTSYDKSLAYANAEKTAQSKKINIWSTKSPMAPWDYRKMKRKK